MLYWHKKIFVFLLLTVAVTARAQQSDSTRFSGWAVKTNAIEWLLTVPNVNFEVDLTNSPYNRMTLGVTAKYNWQTYHKYVPYCAFDLFDIRPEFRYYFRTHAIKSSESKTKFSDFEEWFDYNIAGIKESKLKNGGGKTPKDWRAYYLGVYADYATYAFKFSPEGIQGNAIGFGISAGYGIPLYQYKKFAVDLELGASLGFVLSKYDNFAHDPVGHYYYPTQQKDLHFVPFPVVSELRVAFAFRPVTIGEKYKGVDPVKAEYRKVIDNIRTNFNYSRKENFDYMQSPEQLEMYAADDSLYIADFTAYLDETVVNSMDRIMESNIPDGYKNKAESKVEALRKSTIGAFLSELKSSKPSPSAEYAEKSKVRSGDLKEKSGGVFQNLFKGKKKRENVEHE